MDRQRGVGLSMIYMPKPCASRNQDFEWFAAWAAIAWALALAMPGNMLLLPRYGVFMEMNLSEPALAVLMASLGILWVGGLFINGNWRRSPLLRSACASLGGLVWGQFAWMFLAEALQTGVASSGIGLYALMTWFCIRASWRSLYDWKIASDERNRRVP